MSATRIATALLLQDADVSALVADRIYPQNAPQGAELPFVLIRQISEDAEYLLAGASGTASTRLEINCHASSFAAAEALGEAVIETMLPIIERTVTTAESPSEILGTVTAWKAGADVIDESEDRSVFRRSIDFRLRWRQ